jgi:hypothetical protein
MRKPVPSWYKQVSSFSASKAGVKSIHSWPSPRLKNSNIPASSWKHIFMYFKPCTVRVTDVRTLHPARIRPPKFRKFFSAINSISYLFIHGLEHNYELYPCFKRMRSITSSYNVLVLHKIPDKGRYITYIRFVEKKTLLGIINIDPNKPVIGNTEYGSEPRFYEGLDPDKKPCLLASVGDS